MNFPLSLFIKRVASPAKDLHLYVVFDTWRMLFHFPSTKSIETRDMRQIWIVTLIRDLRNYPDGGRDQRSRRDHNWVYDHGPERPDRWGLLKRLDMCRNMKFDTSYYSTSYLVRTLIDINGVMWKLFKPQPQFTDKLLRRVSTIQFYSRWFRIVTCITCERIKDISDKILLYE